MTPSLLPVWMYTSMMPSDVALSERFPAAARPLARRRSAALSMSPAHSLSAPLQSIMPAPVFVRSAFTSAAEMSAIMRAHGEAASDRRASGAVGANASATAKATASIAEMSSRGVGWRFLLDFLNL